MRDLEAVVSDKAFTSQKFAVGDHVYSVEKADNFEYIDPVDGTVARNQVSLGKREERKSKEKKERCKNTGHECKGCVTSIILFFLNV